MTRTCVVRLASAWLVALGLCCPCPVAAAQKLVYVVRHAERADGGAPPAGMTTPADPELSAAGAARAQKLAAMLADAGVTAIITTEFKRTKNTAAPLAVKLKVTSQVGPRRKIKPGLIARLKKRSRQRRRADRRPLNTVPDVVERSVAG